VADPAVGEALAQGGAGVVLGMALLRILEKVAEKWKPSRSPNASTILEAVGDVKGLVAELRGDLRVHAEQLAETKKELFATKERVDRGLANHSERIEKLTERLIVLEVKGGLHD
jgi:hypothetical protein